MWGTGAGKAPSPTTRRMPSSSARSTTESAERAPPHVGLGPDQDQHVVPGVVHGGPQLDLRPGQRRSRPRRRCAAPGAGPGGRAASSASKVAEQLGRPVEPAARPGPRRRRARRRSSPRGTITSTGALELGPLEDPGVERHGTYQVAPLARLGGLAEGLHLVGEDRRRRCGRRPWPRRRSGRRRPRGCRPASSSRRPRRSRARTGRDPTPRA